MEFETENSSRHQEGWMEALLYSKLEQFILKKGSARQTVNNSNVYTVLRVRLVLTFIPDDALRRKQSWTMQNSKERWGRGDARGIRRVEGK